MRYTETIIVRVTPEQRRHFEIYGKSECIRILLDADMATKEAKIKALRAEAEKPSK